MPVTQRQIASQGRRIGCLGAVSVALCTSIAAQSQTDDLVSWQQNRHERFAEFRASHAAQDEAIKSFKAGHYGLESAPIVLLDDPLAPRMVAIGTGDGVARPLAVGMFPIVVGEYASFVAETGHKPASSCRAAKPGIAGGKVVDWRNPGFPQTMISPVTCVGAADATAYSQWLSKKTGQRYRLLTEAEYDHAARGGEAAPAEAICAKGDQGSQCGNGDRATSPVNSFKANRFGLYDMNSNVRSWTNDCRTGSRSGASRGCLKGQSWARTTPSRQGSAGTAINHITNDIGFRLAREL